MIAEDLSRRTRAERVDRLAAAYILQGAIDALVRHPIRPARRLGVLPHGISGGLAKPPRAPILGATRKADLGRTAMTTTRDLTPQQIAVLRDHATERPFTSPLER